MRGLFSSEEELYKYLERQYGLVNIESRDIPDYITDSLSKELFAWQKKAMQYFLQFEECKIKTNATHLLFNMATGSGKTLLMGALILYYYKKGYKHFLFFVNQTNIKAKTEKNFIDKAHAKYLFKNKVVIDNQMVDIKQVNNFSSYPIGLEIKFTTVQQLYNDINLEKENQLTEEELKKYKIVMLADEAHHLNASTKNMHKFEFKDKLKNTVSPRDLECQGWEKTVLRLKDNNSKNVMLEFTATPPETREAKEKYKDKMVYKFTLRDFLSAGYTKVINLVYSSLEKKERTLLALTFQWCRHLVAQKHEILNFKPVVLFRSKTIEESKRDYEEFLTMVEDLKTIDFDFLKSVSTQFQENKLINNMHSSRIEQILSSCLKHQKDYEQLVTFIKNNFKQQNCIITNSENNKAKIREKTTVEQEDLLNTLENKDNNIRAIFTVQRLTEGWDVLNLFDIVRLYKGQDAGKDSSGKSKAGKSTTAEKQLIGRGVRYYPFEYEDQVANKRKFDNDLTNEMRILEELHFHTDNEHRYISELKKELKKDGYLEEKKIKEVFEVKPAVYKSDFYNNATVYINKKEQNFNKKSDNLSFIKDRFYFEDTIFDSEITELEVDLTRVQDREKEITKKPKQMRLIKIKDIDKHVFRKAVNVKAQQDSSIFRFEHLKNELPIKSIDDLQKEEFLGDLSMSIKSTLKKTFNQLPKKTQLKTALKLLDKIRQEIENNSTSFVGGEFYPTDFKKIFGAPKMPKTKIINPENKMDEITKYDWYLLNHFVGTSEEQAFVEFICQYSNQIEENYKIYLMRNEEVYKIYDFKKGTGFCPDFLLFLESKTRLQSYQIFIEPKGGQFKDEEGGFKKGKEGWKEDFLANISERYGVENKNVIKNGNSRYLLVGLPFYNTDYKITKKFIEAWRKWVPKSI